MLRFTHVTHTPGEIVGSKNDAVEAGHRKDLIDVSHGVDVLDLGNREDRLVGCFAEGCASGPPIAGRTLRGV